MSETAEKPPLFSIITVCLNEPKLERTCESIVNQTFQDFEWIVIDGGSNKETLAVFEKYKSRMDYFVSEPDGGIYYGMNKGIIQAKGEWLNFMNAGDWFYDNKTLDNVVSYIKGIPGIDVFHGIVKLEGGGKTTKYIYSDTAVDRNFFLNSTIHHQAVFIQRKIFNIEGYYRTDYKFLSDAEFLTRLCFKGYVFKFMNLQIAYCDNTGVTSIPPSSEVRKEHQRVLLEFYSQEDIVSNKMKKISVLREKLNYKDK
jgi:glycosyltransferase involved in cell wall biosynthesis